MTTSAARRLVRASAAGTLLALLGVAGAGVADTPTNWESSPSVSAFQFILVLFLIPIALFIVITALTALASAGPRGSSTSDIVLHDPDEPRLDANQR